MNIKQTIVQLIPALIFYLGIFFIIRGLWNFNAILGMIVLGAFLAVIGFIQMIGEDEEGEGGDE